MQEFVRGLFRADYGKEAGEIEACRRATIDTEPEEISIESGAIQIDSTQPIADAVADAVAVAHSVDAAADDHVDRDRPAEGVERSAGGRIVVAPARQVHEVRLSQ